MKIVQQRAPQATDLPGIRHETWAGGAEGLTQVSLWRQTLAPGAATPPHSHDCDEVVLCYSGEGEVHCDGRRERFGGESTVVLPRGRVHQIFNVGETPLELLGVFGSTPVGTSLADGSPIALPWRS
jgi:mannose-6-phosphate isomerase-like protein (cupin superfamily)